MFSYSGLILRESNNRLIDQVFDESENVAWNDTCSVKIKTAEIWDSL